MLDLELWQAIHKAARYNNISTLKALLSQRPSSETLNRGDPEWFGWTPLHDASFKGHLEVVKLLVEAGANVDVTNENGMTPRQLALEKERHEVAELLSEASKTQRAALKKAEELHRQNAEQQAEMARLQAAADERTALQRKNDELQRELQRSQAAFAAQRAELEQQKAQVASLQAAEKQVSAQYTELQATLAAKQQENDQQKAQAKAQSEQARTSRAEVQDRCDQLEAALAKQKESNEELERQNSALTAQVASLEAAEKQSSAQYTELQSHCEEVEQKLQVTETTVAVQHKTMMGLYGEKDELKTKNACVEEAAKQTAAELQHRCEKLQRRLQRSEAAFAEQQDELEQVEEQNKELTAQVARLQTETAQTKAELAAARPSSTSTVAELQRRLDRTQRRLEDAREERNELISKTCELSKQIQALETTCDELLEQLNFCTVENTRYQEAIRQLNERVAELQETIERGYY